MRGNEEPGPNCLLPGRGNGNTGDRRLVKSSIRKARFEIPDTGGKRVLPPRSMPAESNRSCLCAKAIAFAWSTTSFTRLEGQRGIRTAPEYESSIAEAAAILSRFLSGPDASAKIDGFSNTSSAQINMTCWYNLEKRDARPGRPSEPTY